MESGAGGSPIRVAVFVRKNKAGFEMRDVTGTMQYVFAAMGGALGAVMGGFDGFLYALIVFVVVDYVAGVMVVIFSLVAVAHIIDTHVIRNGSVLRTAVIFSFSSMRGFPFWRMR